ncbi:MAG: aspartate aminotransferase family protein [Phototrophicales bacterium]|nr:MAG: aspartate aminotransferase family protein [Phototrophicales bacterium]
MIPDIQQTVTRTEQLIQDEHDVILQTYKRPPFVLVHGQGVHVFDSTGKSYLDWVAGIAVNALGYGDKDVQAVINQQLATGLIHTSNLYHTVPHVELAKLLTEKSFADRVFFTNSGTEANEGAIKFARKVAYEKGYHDKTELVSFSNAFHGRTMGSLSLTPKEKYQTGFKPLLPAIRGAVFNDIESARAVINANTAGVLIEPIQGEGGINVATPEFLAELRALCDEHDALLIFDEIQCGMGRTGTLWAHEAYDVKPDIMTLAKPLAGGLPIGAILVTNEVASAIQVGNHGSTFAGNPFVTSVAKHVLERLSAPEFLAHVREVGGYLQEKLKSLTHPDIVEVRGRGLMVGLEFKREVDPIIQAGYEHGLLMVNAGTHVIRFVPPLIIEKHHVDTLYDKLTLILETF